MTTVVLSGGEDALGRRVARLLAAEPRVDRVVELDHEDLHHGDLKTRIEGATTIVHLDGEIDTTHEILEAAGAVGVSHVVLLSSATVYGAWPSNPVPLTEDATLRPNPQFGFAARAAERERLAADWRIDHPGSTVTVLRPAPAVAEDAVGWLARGLKAAAAIRSVGPDDPPMQYVHLDDLAAAVLLATTGQLDGAFNVAPDGWIPGDRLPALAGVPRVRLPRPIARRLAWTRWRFGLAPTPPGLLPYVEHPWVVANDRLEGAGWRATFTNEEAYVAGHKAVPWATISPQRRQELSLGIAGTALVGGLVGIFFVVRRIRRRRRNALA